MKVSKEQAAANRERILDVAGQLFRERGFDGIGVADLMKSAGLTHGGFYGHFESKEDLMVQACERAFVPKIRRWKNMVEAGRDTALATILNDYLRPVHRDKPGSGCVIAALAAEAPRQGPRMQRAVTNAAEAQVEVLTTLMPGKTKKARRDKALLSYAGMIGALILSRAVDDPALSEEFLKSVAGQLNQLGSG